MIQFHAIHFSEVIGRIHMLLAQVALMPAPEIITGFEVSIISDLQSFHKEIDSTHSIMRDELEVLLHSQAENIPADPQTQKLAVQLINHALDRIDGAIGLSGEDQLFRLKARITGSGRGGFQWLTFDGKSHNGFSSLPLKQMIITERPGQKKSSQVFR